MTDTQCLRLHAVRGRMARSGAAGHRWPAAYGQGNSLGRRWAHGAIRASGRAGAVRAWRGPRASEAAIPARRRRTRPQPHAPARYPARHAGERGRDGLKHGRRVAARYAHRCGGFLDLDAAKTPRCLRRGQDRERASTAQAKITGMSLSLESKTARRPLPSRCAV